MKSSRKKGFTLVELLTVIVMIGILASLITGAAIMARAAVRRTVVLSEIGQLDVALKNYKTKFGEYPPDFAGVTMYPWPWHRSQCQPAGPRSLGTSPPHSGHGSRVSSIDTVLPLVRP